MQQNIDLTSSSWSSLDVVARRFLRHISMQAARLLCSTCAVNIYERPMINQWQLLAQMHLQKWCVCVDMCRQCMYTFTCEKSNYVCTSTFRLRNTKNISRPRLVSLGLYLACSIGFLVILLQLPSWCLSLLLTQGAESRGKSQNRKRNQRKGFVSKTMWNM